MPGLIAIIDKDCNESLLQSMISSITHEEWQKTDSYIQSPLSVARVHLGILNPAKQPIFNENGTVFIFLDGEIYTEKLERKKLHSKGHKFDINNDAEFCLHLYEEIGDNFVEKIEGSFTLVIYDIRKERIIIANDRHGLRPLYYTKIGKRIVFASEVKAILRDNNFKKEIDNEAIADFFAFGWILGDKTFFREVKSLLPGSIAIWSKEKLDISQYWKFEFKDSNKAQLNINDYANNLVALIRKAAKKQTQGNSRIGVFLSGG